MLAGANGSFYFQQALEQLEQFVRECDRRTEHSKKKLAETQEELSAEATMKLNKINELAEEIGKKLADAEAKVSLPSVTSPIYNRIRI